MMGALDEYSTYLVPAEGHGLQEQLSGEYQGIGVWVDFPEGRATIVAPIPGSPAEAAGLRAGDVIEAVDGNPISGVAEDAVLGMVRGPEGSTVTLTIRRQGSEGALTVPVVRGRIPLHSVVYQPLEGDLAWIAVSVFGDRTTAELDAALEQAIAAGATGIVLDLRNNGGGWVESAKEMIGRFVPESAGPALYEDERPDGRARESEPIVAGAVQVYDLPVVVLVNAGTASAAEIVTGALRDYGRATVIGESTFGKGSVQRVHDFEDGSSARITFAEWLTPSLHRIQGVGITPDQEVELGPAEGTGPRDSQMRAAVAELRRLQMPADAPSASPIASPVAA
jgi:carboxyl-terminal processing protease